MWAHNNLPGLDEIPIPPNKRGTHNSKQSLTKSHNMTQQCPGQEPTRTTRTMVALGKSPCTQRQRTLGRNPSHILQ
jgi:hypothetical protein